MSGLAFLNPDAALETIVARTPMERRARAAGASFERRAGWNVAVSFAERQGERERLTQTVGFADRSQLTKLEIQAPPGTLAAIVAESGGGLTLTPRSAERTDGTWWCPVTPARALVLAETQDGSAERLRAAVADAAGVAGDGSSEDAAGDDGGEGREGGTVSVVDLTSGLAALALAGPGANELLARFCAIDVRPSSMPVGAFRPGSVARTPGYVLREREDQLLVLVGWALGEYLWEVVADAAEHLGGGPVGADALAEHAQAVAEHERA